MEDKKADAVAHLALARSQNTRNGISGFELKSKQLLLPAAFCDLYEVFMEKKRSILEQLIELPKHVSKHKTGAYAAQAAYFFVLSFMPIVLLLLTLVQFTPVTQIDVLEAVKMFFPTSVQGLVISIVRQVYTQSTTIIPITVVVALWSAGKGVLSVTSGLNEIYENTESRRYLYLRIRATFYTVLFIIAIVSSLVLSVFGNTISLFVINHIPVLTGIVKLLLRTRTLFTFCILTLFWDLVYKFLPDRTKRFKTTLKRQLPGAIFTSISWLVLSYVFSVYLDIFKGFSNMYGSLTTIILIMLWLYFCMYVILLGGEINVTIEECYNGLQKVNDTTRLQEDLDSVKEEVQNLKEIIVEQKNDSKNDE